MKDEVSEPLVGRGIIRLDGVDKVRGRAQYTDDLEIPGCWHGALVRAPVAHGRLRGLHFDPGFDWSRVVVATPADIPGPNIVVMHDRSMPLLAFDEILYLGEPLAVVAAPTARLAREAAAHIRADVAELPAILHLRELSDRYKAGDLAWTRLAEKQIVKGDVAQGLAAADFVVEDEHTAGHQEQLYIEPQGMVAIPQDDGGLFLQGSLQCPYYVQHELHEALNLPCEKIRVKQAAVGGAFGGKEDYPTMLGGYCALAALKARRPVKIVYDRHEDIGFTPKRHPVWVRHRGGVKKDGTITALQVDFMLDGGAYLTLSDVVMFRGILHAALGYRCEHVRVNGMVARTHTVPSGAFRGFGAPQAIWGLETHIDRLARACGRDPHTFRLQNCLRLGDTTPTGQVLRDSVGSPAVIETALRRAGFEEKLRRCSRGRPDARTWYGIGLSFFAHGAAFTGDGEVKINARVALELDRLEDGRPGVIARVSSTEMGQGAHTVLAQMTADGLGLRMDRVRRPVPDTALAPDSGPTVASRTTLGVGSSLYGAAAKLQRALEAEAGRPVRKDSFEDIAAAYLARHSRLRIENQFKLPDDIRWDQQQFRGDAYPGYSWGCNIAEVEIDPRTLVARVAKITACYDIGRVVNPLLAKGQIEGGLVQALGYAVMEQIGIRNGKYDADRLQTYIIPTTLDIPAMDIVFVEFPYAHAAPGAKGVGEIPMDGLAPALANAVEQALGIRMRDLPITPEKLLAAIRVEKPDLARALGLEVGMRGP